jgi:hypothetical protein
MVNRPGQTWWKTVCSPKSVFLQCLALKIKVDTLRIFFNLQEAVNGKPRPGRFTPGNNPVPIVQDAGWDPGPFWTGAENLDPTRFRPPDRPTRSESLYRLSYPAHCLVHLLNGEYHTIKHSGCNRGRTYIIPAHTGQTPPKLSFALYISCLGCFLVVLGVLLLVVLCVLLSSYV